MRLDLPPSCGLQRPVQLKRWSGKFPRAGQKHRAQTHAQVGQLICWDQRLVSALDQGGEGNKVAGEAPEPVQRHVSMFAPRTIDRSAKQFRARGERLSCPLENIYMEDCASLHSGHYPAKPYYPRTKYSDEWREAPSYI